MWCVVYLNENGTVARVVGTFATSGEANAYASAHEQRCSDQTVHVSPVTDPRRSTVHGED